MAYDLAARPSGETRRIFVHVPAETPPPEGWPLLVMTDGNAMIATAVDALRVQASYPGGTNVGPGVIAAIGYPVDAAYDPLRRSFDLSPPPGRHYPPFTPAGPPVRTGGADELLRFIEGDLLPFLERLVPIDAARRTLFGHSFGGLFALHALFSGAGLFSRYVAASPTIYWEDGGLLEAERRFGEEHDGSSVFVHLSSGEYEGETLAPFQYGRDDTEARLAKAKEAQTTRLAREMAGRLGALPGLAGRFETYPGETHMTVLPVAVARAVRVAFGLSLP
ncbi:alpha/beta hydrolase [Aureimonas endophytica]|nr:alpha/beta hydrolase-fold protein [Aureimonas endophytica]